MPMKNSYNLNKIKQISQSSLCGLLMICVALAYSQSTEQNYIKQTDLLIKEDSTSNIGSLMDGEKLVNIQYFDGLGRLIQTNAYHQSPNRNDIIRYFEYDEAGRQEFSYLPFPNNADGMYLSNAHDLTTVFYNFPTDPTITADGYPYGKTEFDNSPLNRVMKQGFPGEPWQLEEHPQQFAYTSNVSDDIILLEMDEQTLQFSGIGYYQAQSLYVTQTWDENQNLTVTYKDKQDRVVVKESIVSDSSLRTYYLYNAFGNLAVVISPEGSKLLNSSFSSSDSFIQQWCYTYTYDQRQRLVEKRIPGMTAPICYVYDPLDRVILTRDGNLKEKNLWLFTKYDVLGRIIMEGKYTNAQYTSRSAMQSFADTYAASHSLFESRSSTTTGYTQDAFPPYQAAILLKVYYYDDYDFNNDASPDYHYKEVEGFHDMGLCENAHGLLTGTRIKNITEPHATALLPFSVNFYDSTQRIIQQQFQNYIGGYDTITTQYNFAGDVIRRKHSHNYGGSVSNSNMPPTYIIEEFEYDHARRLIKNTVKVNGQSSSVQTVTNYNELGQLTEKNLINASVLVQSLDYRYNIRGWLKGINIMNAGGNDSDDKFFEELLYDNAISPLQCTTQYNGNIAAQIWKNVGDNVYKGYGYTYDGLNRLTKAIYGRKSGPGWEEDSTYSVTLVQYDQNGNIKRLRRRGNGGMMDDLTYSYISNGNQVDQIVDAGSKNYGFRDADYDLEYTYDANGNMIMDKNKGIISITYNHLNLPEVIKFEDNLRIEYFYDANGVKLQKRYYEDNLLNTTTDYSGEFVYTNRSIDYISIAEGRLKKGTNGTYIPEFFLKDHLGNVRVVLSSAGSPVQGTDYYPFGMEIPLFSSSNNQLKYNSKELQTEAGLKWYDYGWRMYDPQLGRFHTQDRFAEKYLDFSPYQYAANNPILYIDVNGDSINVAEEHREALNKDLTNAFGDKASNFSYDKNGNLVYNGNGKKDFKGDQRDAFKSLDKVMSSEDKIELKYAETHTDAKGNETNVVKDWGGGLYDADQNVIVISPNATDIKVTEYSDNPGQTFLNMQNPTTVKQNTTSALFHEVGEVNAGKSEYRGSVIDTENNVRGIMKMNTRPYDMYHHPKPATTTTPTN
ncbi:MAG: DUF6443 domain-containing protein [Bacteroidales bacterium]|nr:DUF6443 domain-containing protein [Bacteroidales bacterium]